METTDIVIAGGGAAGLMAAAQAAQRGRKVILLEKGPSVGEKIRISGGGRCNFTNIHCAPNRYISKNPHFCKSALARYTQHDFIALVKKHDIAYHEKTLGQLFCDGKSQQIIDMLLKECEGADVRVGQEINAIDKTDNGFILDVNGDDIACEKLVIATGGPSIPKMGATNYAYEIARQFGHNIITPRAALVPLTFTDDVLNLARELSGISVDPARVSYEDTSFDEAVLFTHRGLSGPAILQISSYWNEGDEITVNLCPSFDAFVALKNARKTDGKKQIATLVSQWLPQRIADKICPAGTIADAPDEKLSAVAQKINAWKFKPNGTEGYRTAEVTRGGIDTDEISSKTFESKKTPGLYFIGECVDVTGWLGGYNFQWAWSSGWCAGQVL